MKLPKMNAKFKQIRRKQAMEDLRYLQKKISGKSVYANLRSAYNRVPKHRGQNYLTKFNALRGN